MNRSVLRQETSRTSCVSNHPGGRASVGSHDHRIHQHIVFTLGACHKVDNMDRLTTTVAPDGCLRCDFTICVGDIILQVLHLALPHDRVSPSGSSSRLPCLSLAHTRRSLQTLWSSVVHDWSFCEDPAQSCRRLDDGPVSVDYIPHFW